MTGAIDALNALSPDEVRSRLEEDPAAFLRQAAEAGSAEAQARLGQMLLDTGNASEGFRWFVAAAQQEHVEAINMVGRCYDLGWGTPVDKVRAAEWFRAASLRGLDWGMYNYATALALGAGVQEDKAAALHWFEKAAILGNAKAMNFIGSFHEDGWIVPKDMAKAATFYARAAKGGDFRGCFNHARMLADMGEIDTALPWFERAADTGNDRFRMQAADYLGRASDPRLIAAATLLTSRIA